MRSVYFSFTLKHDILETRPPIRRPTPVNDNVDKSFITRQSEPLISQNSEKFTPERANTVAFAYFPALADSQMGICDMKKYST